MQEITIDFLKNNGFQFIPISGEFEWHPIEGVIIILEKTKKGNWLLYIEKRVSESIHTECKYISEIQEALHYVGLHDIADKIKY